MEFIKVQVARRPDAVADVLINGQINGQTGALLTLGGPGFVSISVNLPKAKRQVVDVMDTTALNPMSIVIDCD
jgi:hypothetical protein